ncbi:MAG: MBL fold metallo-hydrolase, partial [Eggerthellaceae bacterium]|nr:MBL fold metallo-hydrolase [Eggerthellaceae bacterium]
MGARTEQQARTRDDVVRSWSFDGYDIHQVGADLGGEAFLLCTADGATALFDTGFAFCAAQTLENIYAFTGGAPVDKIILTHSHYDHCAATGYLLAHMPDAKVHASAHAARVFSRPGAFATMSALNADRAASKGIADAEDVPSEIGVDVVLEDGDTFSVGNMVFSALSAVGHTRCCLAFWCESAGLFVSSETSGVVCTALPSGVE